MADVFVVLLVPIAVVTVLDLLVATWVATKGPRSASAFMFFLVMLLTAGMNGVGAAIYAALALGWLWMLGPLLWIDTPLRVAGSMASLAFLASYARPSGRAPGAKLAWGLFGVLTLFTAAYIALPQAYVTMASPRGFPEAIDSGPLSAVNAVIVPFNIIIGFVLFARYARCPPGPFRDATFFVALGWSIPGAYQASFLLDAGLSRWGFFSRAPLVSGWDSIIRPSALVLALALFVTLIIVLRGVGANDLDPAERTRARLAARLLVFVFVLSAIIPVAILVSPIAGYLVEGYAQGLALAAMPLLVAYALARHRLFDSHLDAAGLLELDARGRGVLNRSSLFATAALIFAVVTPVATKSLGESLGGIIGAVIGALLGFFTEPSRAAAERIARTLLPRGLNRTSDEGGRGADDKRIEVYRLSVEFALADGTLSREEDRHLHDLAAELGIDASRAYAVREEAAERSGAFAAGARFRGAE